MIADDAGLAESRCACLAGTFDLPRTPKRRTMAGLGKWAWP
jgi:hypothetical protein